MSHQNFRHSKAGTFLIFAELFRTYAFCVHAPRSAVILDLGGEDRPLSADLLAQVTYLTANETELVCKYHWLPSM